jgi:hypothetical protein
MSNLNYWPIWGLLKKSAMNQIQGEGKEDV